MIASVVVDCKIDTVNRTFDYLVPPCFTSSIAIGQRVYVPFGKQNLLGIVVELKDESGFNNLKEIYDEIYKNGKLKYEIETFTEDGKCKIKYYR